jgi:beta-1,4-mannosyltransferase
VSTSRRAVFYWEERGIGLDDERVNPYGGLLARGLAPLGVTVEAGWRIDPEWVREQHGRVDVLHMNWLHKFYADPDGEVRRARFRELVKGLVLARRLGIRLVWTVHNLYPHETHDAQTDRRVRRLVCALAHAVIVHCDHARELVAQHFGRTRDVFTIPHGNFMDVYPNTIGRAAARERLGLSENTFVYVFFGNIRAYKGVERLLEVFSALPGERLRLVIAGRLHQNYRGPLRDGLDTLDKRIVFRPGTVSIQEMQVYFNAANAAVMPFVDTLTSGSAITALGFGCPVILPTVGCLPELLAGRPCGVLYDPQEPDGLRRALEEVRDGTGSATREGALARARDLAWSEIARQTLIAYGA